MSELEFEFRIPIEDSCLYEDIAEEAFDLKSQGLNYSAIARILGVTDKTVKKAIVRKANHGQHGSES